MPGESAHAKSMFSYTDRDFYLTPFTVDVFVGMLNLGDTSRLSLQSRFIQTGAFLMHHQDLVKK